MKENGRRECVCVGGGIVKDRRKGKNRSKPNRIAFYREKAE